ncbi:peptidoglycan DD-metalloendopeptidase family protein [Acidimicrobiales bacterium]|nr:peptidoglycan DD-metalloendopeptidase family protein [Acidimicrobiales bacterium]
MRTRLMLAVVAVSLLLVVPVDAQTSLDQAREDVAGATDRLEALLEDLDTTQRRGNELAALFWQAQAGLEALDIEIVNNEAAAAELATQIADLRAEVKIIAVDQYMSRADDIDVGDHESESDRAAAEALARLVIGVDNTAIDQLAVIGAESDRLSASLAIQRSEQAARLAEVQSTQQSIADELERLARLRSAVAAELLDLEDALGELEQAESERQAAAAEQERIVEERRRAEAAAAAAAELARRVPTPAPTPAPTPVPTVMPTPTVVATVVPNPQLPDPTPTVVATVVPNPQLPDPTPTVVATVVPNPQLPDPTPTVVPNPQPSTPLTSTGGGIVCPLGGPFTHIDDFSAPRVYGGVHRANDLIAAQGTPVLAAASGSIDHRSSSVGGMSAHLKGDNGDYYFYTHLSGYENVGAGYVTAGTVIGYVGMTGNAPIPHLHFEIHSGGYGNYSNPYGPVRSACF